MGAWENREETLASPEEIKSCLECSYPECIDCVVASKRNLGDKALLKRRYTDYEIKLLKNTELSNRELADKLGRTISAIQFKRKELKVIPSKRSSSRSGPRASVHGWTEEKDEIVIDYTPSKAALMLGMPVDVIKYRRNYLLYTRKVYD